MGSLPLQPTRDSAGAPPPAGSGMKPRLKTGFGSFCARNLRGDKYRLVFLTLMATSDIRTGHEKLQQ